MLFFACLLLPGLNAHASPGGVLVWHFDQGVANRWGGMYNVYALQPSWARTYLDPSVHRQGAGHSLRVTAHRETGFFCGLWLEFYPASGSHRRYLDASSYRFLSFWIKGPVSGENFDITLEDDTGQQHADKNPSRPLHSYLPKGASNEWQEVAIPLEDFRGLNLRRLVRLTLNFTHPEDSRFYLDDIAFKSEKSAAPPSPGISLPVRAENSRSPLRAMWIWNTQELFSSVDETDRFFNFCSKMGVHRVFLSLDLDKTSTLSAPHFELREPDRYRKFLERAHPQGLEVEALVGTPEWAARENHPYALAAVDAVIDFNRALPRGARFDGLHFDVEPYSLAGYADAAHAAALLEDFLRMISLCARRIHAGRGLRFTCDVPAYFYPASGLEVQQLLVKFEGRRKTVGEHLTDLLDEVTIMDYRNEADGAGGVIAGALPALRYAASEGKSILVGVETSVEPDSTAYFVCGLPREEFRKRLAASELGNQLFVDGRRLTSFSDELNIHVGLMAPADLAGADLEAFDKTLVHLAGQLGAASDPERISADAILNEARAALAQDPEWKGFETFELIDPDTHRSVKGFRTVHCMAPKTTFQGLGREVFDEETRSVGEWLGPYPSYGGLAIHFYDSYRNLLEGK